MITTWDEVDDYDDDGELLHMFEYISWFSYRLSSDRINV